MGTTGSVGESAGVDSRLRSIDTNEWSAEHQVSLEVVLTWAAERGATIFSRLPWGAPIFEVRVRGRVMRVAAYTEPNLFWERTNGVARSWNLMADGSCLASLEDRGSILSFEQAAAAS